MWEESVGVSGGLEEGRTGRSSSMNCGVMAIEAEEEEEGGWKRTSESACSESRRASRNRSKFS